MHEIQDPSARVPCAYDLRWNQTRCGIEVLCHHSLWEFMQEKLLPNSKAVQDLAEFSLPEFVVKNRRFGFGGCWKVRRGSEWYHTLFAPLPRVRVRGAERCAYCDGTGRRGGRRPLADVSCVWCEGFGRAYTMHWDRAYLQSATWTIFLRAAECFLSVSEGLSGAGTFAHVSRLTQLLEVRTVATLKTTHGYGFSTGGRYAAAVWKELARIAIHSHLPEVEEAMMRAHHRMVWLLPFEKSSFGAQVSAGGWLVLRCPGQRSGIGPAHDAHRDIKKGRGYEFQCTNVDGPVQQLDILAGLAALITLLRVRGVV